jgi:hypothetical protein
MEREKTGAELLLSEPEIVAWLGLDDKHDDLPAPPRGLRQAVLTPRDLRVGIVL